MHLLFEFLEFIKFLLIEVDLHLLVHRLFALIRVCLGLVGCLRNLAELGEMILCGFPAIDRVERLHACQCLFYFGLCLFLANEFVSRVVQASEALEEAVIKNF